VVEGWLGDVAHARVPKCGASRRSEELPNDSINSNPRSPLAAPTDSSIVESLELNCT
jgi:hypothetical protein